MKRKEKVITILGLSVLMCSLFLVIIPVTAIAAGQDDYVLGIYGNANEDDTIDMRDLTYVKLIFFGKKPETELADAKYDGKINPLDFIQIKLIIVGKEKELTIVDSADRIVTVKKPLERIVAPHIHPVETLRSLKASDAIVGVGYLIVEDDAFFPEFSEVTNVGSPWDADVEAILSLEPNAVILHTTTAGVGATLDTTQRALESAGISVLRLNFNQADIYPEEVEKLGYIFDKEEEAEELLDWLSNILNSIEEVVEKIPEEDKPKLYCEANAPYTSYSAYTYIDFTGGIDIFSDATGPVDAEEIIEQNPAIIVKLVWQFGGYHLDASDTVELKRVRDELMNRDVLKKVKAVEEGKVYVMSTYIYGAFPNSGCRHFLQLAYQAKWFHPDLFEDLDPKALHQEYLTRFQGLDIDLEKKGVFVYSEPS